jgi:2,3-bisphosphoglycerate-dependent phosphoglycerate mutase
MKASAIIPTVTVQIPSVTTVYIVRHADKADDGGTDPDLSAAGHQRAQTLAYMLRQDKVQAVYVTSFRRSRQTGEPTASASGIDLTDYSSPEAVADLILANHAGKRVLVVAHSNTVKVIASRLIASLAVPAADLREHQYDRFYVVHRIGPKGHLDRLRYGAPTP